MKTTYMANPNTVERKSVYFCPEELQLLRGKNKPTFTPHVDTGDHVIVINAEKVRFTGKKLTQKTYFRHSGYPGGSRFVTLGNMLEKHPERVVEMAVRGMLPKNKLGAQIYRKLNVYAGPEHPHAAQKPEVLEFDIR